MKSTIIGSKKLSSLFLCSQKRTIYKSGFGELGNLSSVTNTYLTVSTHIDPKQKAKAT